MKSSISKQSPQRSAGGRDTTCGVTSTPSSTDDMNSALLRCTSVSGAKDQEPTTLNNNMFGHFKGFTLKPLPNSRTPNLGATNVAFVHPVAKTAAAAAIIEEQSIIPNGVPNRSAPPIPKQQTSLIHIKTDGQAIPPLVHQQNSRAQAPALPPFNPGSTARPLISSPILEASTCSAKELISPLRHNAEKTIDKYPILRQAPVPPGLECDVLSQGRLDPKSKDKKFKEWGTMSRIASFLKKDERTTAVKIKPSLNKEKLKNIEISSPISTSGVSDNEPINNRSSISRTQSMREPVVTTITKRTNILTFGSMRQPGTTTPIKRPGSIVGTNSRPKSPPPPRPPAPPSITSIKICGIPGYQNPPPMLQKVNTSSLAPNNEYDDCEAVEVVPLAKINEDISPAGSDNIYSVIEEYQSPANNKPKVVFDTPSNQIANTSCGLLGEIVNEIENRNLDSIYSVSTLHRNKTDTVHPYVNTADISSAEYTDEYTPSKSNASTTSSGYLRPSAINAPVARIAPVNKSELAEIQPVKQLSNNLSSFKRNPNDEDVDDKALEMVSTLLDNKANRSLPSKPVLVKNVLPKPARSEANAKLLISSTSKTTFNRTKTPPTMQTTKIRTRSPSPTSKPKPPAANIKIPVKNVPIIKTNVIKPKPDIIATGTSNKPKPLTDKPEITTKLSGIKASASISVNKTRWPLTDKTSATESIGQPVAAPTTLRPTSKSSNVASLQQKFESEKGARK